MTESAVVLIVEWEGISARRVEKRGPFASPAAAWEWYRARTGYPLRARARVVRADSPEAGMPEPGHA